MGMSTPKEDASLSNVILHAVWTGGALHVFGIDPTAARPDGESPRRRRGRSGQPAAGFLPHALLHEALEQFTSDRLLSGGASESRLSLWLPPIENAPPVPAPDAPPAVRADDAGPALTRQTVPTLTFAPADAVDLLVELGGASAASPTAAGWSCPPVRISDSVRFWSTLARWAMMLLSRRRFCPDVWEQPDGRVSACWRLFVHDSGELAWLERFAAAMPPVCRFVAGIDPNGSTATSLVEDFLAQTTDTVIRRVLSGDSFFRQVSVKAKEQGTWDLHWLAALVGKDPVVRAPKEDAEQNAEQARAWLAQAGEAGDRPAPRLTFTLNEPTDERRPDRAKWRLDFTLRSGESGETLDLAELWAHRDDRPTLLGSHLQSRRQHFTAQLNRAAEVFPEIRRAIRREGRCAIDLTTAEAYSFLRERAPLLRAGGFDVHLPAWADELDQRLGLHLHLRPASDAPAGGDPSLSAVGLGNLLDFDWRVAVGGDQLSVEEFERLAAQKTPLVKLHGRWIAVDHAAAARAMQFLQDQPQGRISLLAALRLVGGVEEIDAGLPIVGFSGSDWLESFLSRSADAQLEAFDPPPALLGTLRPYQLRGLHWLAFLDRLGIGACLADDMGLGKTIQLLALLMHERRNGATVGPTLLFAPMSVVGNWEREIERFAPSLRVLVHHGPDRLSGDAFVRAAESSDIVITTYGLAGREMKNFSRVAWHRIGMDEAQKIKNPSAQQTAALKSLAAPRRVALTGTPLENHLYELWSIMDALNPGLLGGAGSFRNRFAVPIEKMGDQERADRLRRLIGPFVLRRMKDDPAVACDLPEKMEMRVYCNLTPEQAALYERLVAVTLEDIDGAAGIRRRGLILATLTKLKQVCNHPVHLLRSDGPLDGRSGKCERLVEMLEEVIEEGDHALVFTQFREMGTLLRRMLQERLKIEIPFLHGGTPIKKRNEMIQTFQDPTGSHRIFLLSLKAGGFGINLTRANHVFHFDRWWNPAVENQAADRVHRIGQTRTVQIHKFVCVGTVEERIDRLLSEKMALADRIIGSGDEWLTGLSTAELRDYLALGKEAVAED